MAVEVRAEGVALILTICAVCLPIARYTELHASLTTRNAVAGAVARGEGLGGGRKSNMRNGF